MSVHAGSINGRLHLAERRQNWRDWSAERTLTRRQIAVAGAFVLAFVACLAVEPVTAGSIAIAVVTVGFLATTVLRVTYLVAGYRARVRKLPDEDVVVVGPLPVYSVLVPLYREAEVVPALLDALDGIDYPFDKLEVLLLVEHDDPETRAACERHIRPGWRVLTVPAGEPRTKPRALNEGLPHVTGEFVTIYDAEDRPDVDQLRKAVREFRRLPDSIACLQARLDYYNARQNLLTKWFACEYATHFGLYLEGVSSLGHALPLGGTSCHFRTRAVRDLGGWDEWNVTEDCELGMRLAAAGLSSRTLDSTTWEEAVPMLRRWVRQRSRWVKGFAQTTLVLLRAPVRTARAMGLRRYLAALTAVGGVPMVLLLQVVFWALLWTYVALRAGGFDVTPIEALFPEPFLSLGMVSLLIGNFAVLLAHVAVVYQQERYELVRYALLIPVYWLLTSVGAWRGVLQLLRRPHFWEKTEHGLAPTPQRTEERLVAVPNGSRRIAAEHAPSPEMSHMTATDA